MTRAYLSMGANIGDRLGNLQRGVQLLHAMPAITVTAVSQVYETQPVGGVAQDDFYNIAVRLETTLSCLLYTSPSPRDGLLSRMPSSA